MEALGRHILVEFMGCQPELLDDVTGIEKAMVAAARKAGATVLHSAFHHFAPSGVSGMVVIQESHLAIHSWPEYQYAAVDLFTCGETVNPWRSFDFLKEAFQAQNHTALELHRGSLNLLNRAPAFRPRSAAAVPEQTSSSLSPTRSLWFTDRSDSQAVSLRYQGEPLFQIRNEFGHTQVLETSAFGKLLAHDGSILFTELDEAAFHEMFVHPSAQLHPEPRVALILGGGDGGVARELLRYPSLERIILIERNPAITSATRGFFPALSRALHHPKVEIRFEDARQALEKIPPGSIDLIFVDGDAPTQNPDSLYSEGFFHSVADRLSESGILTLWAGSPYGGLHHPEIIHRAMSARFSSQHLRLTQFPAPVAAGGVGLAWVVASDPRVWSTAESRTAHARRTDFIQRNEWVAYSSAAHAAAYQPAPWVMKLISTSKTAVSSHRAPLFSASPPLAPEAL